METAAMFAAVSTPSLYWLPFVARCNVEALVLLSSGWLRTACLFSALFWLAFRAYKVLSQPVDKLIQVLGLEVPVAPLVSLAGIKADGVLLHWKPPGQRVAVLKYVIRINGIDIGDISPQETSITIENLQPNRHYTIRIATLNSSNFQAPSIPIRLRTLSADSGDYYNPVSQNQTQPSADQDDFTPTPIIRPNKSLADAAISFAPPFMTREHSNSTSSVRIRRPDPVRKSSPAIQISDQARSALEIVEGADSLKHLTEKLNGLRWELDDTERQIQDEDQEFLTQKAILLDKRDEKRAALKEKEDASRDLRKEVASLERQSASAQTRRAHQEKKLRQKEAERKKVKDDVAKWTCEASELRAAAAKIKQDRVECEKTFEGRIRQAKRKHIEQVQINKGLEDAIREKGSQIKGLEAERHALEAGQEGSEATESTEAADREEDNRWKMTLALLQHHYNQAWTLFTEAERANCEASSRLQFIQQRRLSQPQSYSVSHAPEMGVVGRSSQQVRPISMREGLLPVATTGFVHTASAPFNAVPASSSPSFAPITPYFNPVNGMVLPPRTHSFAVSNTDMESLTGGAPMSPTAGALLPAGLFGDDLGSTDAEDEDEPGPSQPSSLDPYNVLPGLGAPGTLDRKQDPASPISPQSRPVSAFASPWESAGDLRLFPNNENNIESDRRSTRSTSSMFMVNPQVSRFGGLFGLNRARGKTFSDEGPSLGSLKPYQSQSLPQQEHDINISGASRRRGSHSEGAWYDTFVRTKTQPAQTPNSPRHMIMRKRPFTMFGTKEDPGLVPASGVDRPDSPGQGSSVAGEGMTLPRPSMESQTRFGWSVDTFSARSSPLGVDWSINNTNTASWKRIGSRRPSLSHGSTSNLTNAESVHDNPLNYPSTGRSPTQAPIGTRPQSSTIQASLPPPLSTPPTQLNPTAAAFTMFQLGRKNDEEKEGKAKRAAEKAAGKEAKKAEKAGKKEEKEKRAKAERAEKAARKEKDRHTLSEASHGRDAIFLYADSRISHETPSISNTSISEASPRESLEHVISYPASENPGSLGKESFMQKLTRKGSTNQFLAFKKNALLSKNKASDVPKTPDEADEEGGFLGSGRGIESMGNSPNTGTVKDKSSLLSWGTIKRIGKKDRTPSMHESIASEVTGDEDDGSPDSSKK